MAAPLASVSLDAALLRVLVVEDDPASADVLATQLRASGYLVRGPVGTAADALNECAAERPDAVVLDVRLPDRSGLDVAAELAHTAPDVGVVLYTGDPDVSVADLDAARLPAAALLPKPVSRLSLDATARLTVARTRDLTAARREAAAARRQLEERKVIERAKGILMRRTGASEQEAYRILQRSSQDKGIPMVQLAHAVLASEPGVAPTSAVPGTAQSTNTLS